MRLTLGRYLQHIPSPMENAKKNLKALLLAIQERLLTPNTAAKDAVAEVAARNVVNSSSLLTC